MNGGATGWRRVSAWGPPALVCAVFLLVGVITMDDYGVAPDRKAQRRHAEATIEYIRHMDEDVLHPIDRYFGVAFQLPLVMVERVFQLEDERGIKLSRHFLTHLLFAISGIFCYLLVYRLFNNRIIALLAMALFLVHPRIYAHSFFNTKDLPFLSMFMITLYITHRSFQKKTALAFILLGIAVGILVNLRIMGITLFAIILAWQALDLIRGEGARRFQILNATGLFILFSVLTMYATIPYLWSDTPGRIVDMFATLSRHPQESYQLFRGEPVFSREIPREYLPVWFAITTPPFLLILGLLGTGALCVGAVRNPWTIPRDHLLRFGLLALACFAVPVLAVVLLRPTLFDGWRHLYFLHAPFTILAAFGLHGLVSAFAMDRVRRATYVLAGIGVTVTIVSMVRLYPYQGSYFNLLPDRNTTDSLSSQFIADYFYHISSDLMAETAGDYSSGELYFAHEIPSVVWRSAVPVNDQARMVHGRGDISSETASDFAILTGAEAARARLARFPNAHVRELHGSQVVAIVPHWFANAREAALADEPLVRSVFAIHRAGRELTYLRDGCSPDDAAARFLLHVFPMTNADLPGYRQRHGFDNLDFPVGARIDGNCVATALLPDYPIARIRTGQFAGEGIRWQVEFTPDGRVVAPAPPPDYPSARRRALDGEPLARSAFDVYRDGRALTYVRDGCSDEEAAARFFLHVHPADVGDLPEHRRGYGFDNLDFTLAGSGARMDGNCVAVARLPDYAIARVRTGQYDEAGQRWAVEFAWPGGE